MKKLPLAGLRPSSESTARSSSVPEVASRRSRPDSAARQQMDSRQRKTREALQQLTEASSVPISKSTPELGRGDGKGPKAPPTVSQPQAKKPPQPSSQPPAPREAWTMARAASEYQFLITEGFSSSDCSSGKTYSDIGVPVDVCHPENAEYRKVEIVGTEAIHMYYNDSDCSGNVLRNESFNMNCTQSGNRWFSRRVALHGSFESMQWADNNCTSTSSRSGDPQALGICAIPTATLSMMWVCNLTRQVVQMNSYNSGDCTGSFDVISFIPDNPELCHQEQLGSTCMSDCFTTTTTTTSTSMSSAATLALPGIFAIAISIRGLLL
ncbi:hypothetical protein AK812_SmicGene30643 [Symbiodinium microadriaticum]|uniref:Uncharacterized protein n=1 Tax=Symbiodinium microadriaticum TaxID=2951 RepID=A0A1Q9CYQ8_SYMMI|nr:hypothetical protein AK812_SmicGene30643 [Symbiodinium microadriaticum]